MNLQKLWKNPVTGAPIKEWSSYFIKKAIQPILSQSSNLSWYTTQRMKFCYLSFLFSALVTIKNSDLKYLLCGMLDISDKKQKSDYFCISTYIVHSSISSWIKKKKKSWLSERASSFCYHFASFLKLLWNRWLSKVLFLNKRLSFPTAWACRLNRALNFWTFPIYSPDALADSSPVNLMLVKDCRLIALETEVCCYMQVIIQEDKCFLPPPRCCDSSTESSKMRAGTGALPLHPLLNRPHCTFWCQPGDYGGV